MQPLAPTKALKCCGSVTTLFEAPVAGGFPVDIEVQPHL